MSGKVHEKKGKQEQFQHARDNAIASIGKVVMYQQLLIKQNPEMAGQITKYWIDQLPITHDVEEAQMQYKFLSEFVLEQPEYILTADPTGTAQQIAKIVGECFEEKYFAEPAHKLLMAEAVRYLSERAPGPVQESFKSACQNVLSTEAQGHVQAAYNFRG